MLVVYMTPFCYDRHSMGADLSGLPPKGGSQRVVVLAATASSHNETEIWPFPKVVFIIVATDARDFAWGGHNMGGPLSIARD